VWSMPDRTINFGDPADAGTKYRTQDDDPAGGGNFVVAEDLDGNTVLLQWNPTAGQWEYGGPVDMGGNDLSNVGTISATALEAGEADIKRLKQINFEDSSDIANNRDFDVEYQNTSGETMLVVVTIQTDPSTSGDHRCRFRLEATSGLGVNQQVDGAINDGVENLNETTMNVLVPPGYYYEVSSLSKSDSTVNRWFERGMKQ